MVERNKQDFGYNVSLFFKFCKRALENASVRPIAYLLANEGFHPSPALGGEELYVASDIDALIEERFDDWIADGADFGPAREIAFPLVVNKFPEDKVRCHFAWTVHRDGYVSITLSGTALVFQQEQKTYQEPFAQELLRIGFKLYPLALPVCGQLGDSYVDPDPWEHKRIARQEIVNLSWVNFFGPEYVAKYGREMLAGIPGWHTQDLADGGLLYQSRPSIVVEDKVAHKRWQREVAAYLAQYGVRIRFDYPRD